MAENSRPKTQVKKHKPKPEIPLGRRPMEGPEEQKGSAHVHWMSPFLWAQIDAAARKVGWPYSQAAIVKELNKVDPKTFLKLVPQTVRRWLAQPCVKGKPWSDTTLARVEEGNLFDGHCIRKGALVSDPNAGIL